MKQDVELKLQAYLDGELPGREARQVAAWVANDPAAQQLFEELRLTRNVLRETEPEYAMADSREFYWSKIQRQIAQTEQSAAPSFLESLLALRRYLAPAAGMALVAFLAVGIARFSAVPGSETQHLAEVVSLSEEVGSYSFRSQSENMFVVWLYDKSESTPVQPDVTNEEFFYE